MKWRKLKIGMKISAENRNNQKKAAKHEERHGENRERQRLSAAL
jgi:hypothetical protein